MRWPWSSRQAETRADLDSVIAERALEIASGKSVDSSRLAVAEACAGIYSRCFAAARVEGADALTPGILAVMGRALLFHGEFVGALTADGEIAPASSADVFGRGTGPAEWRYRLFVSTPGGSEEVVAPAESVLHVRIGAGRASPWRGRSPLAGSMADVELALMATEAVTGESSIKSHGMHSVDSETRTTGNPDALAALAKQLIANPSGRTYFSPVRFRTDRIRAEPDPALDAARKTSAEQIAAAAGVPPILLSGDGDGAAAREAYRRFVRATVEPLGRLVEAEASMKLGQPVRLDFQALRASDTAMAARAYAALVGNGISSEEALRIAGLVEAE